MARGPCTFRQRDLTQAIKGASAAGLKVDRVEIDRDGKIVLVNGQGGEKLSPGSLKGWDDVK